MFRQKFAIMLTIDPKSTPIPKLHGYLTSGVGPRPIAFASTIDENGIPNLAPFSFFNVFGANPPVLVFSPARSGKTTETKDSHENVKKVAECVINVVTHDILEQMNLCSSPYDEAVSEFDKSGLTPIASNVVQPFRVKESPVQMECKVLQVIETGDGGASGNLIVCEVVKIHVSEAILQEDKSIDPEKLDLIGRLGGDWFCRPNKSSMFKIHRHARELVIGYDAIPEEIRNSTILSGNDLGKLGGVLALPDETEVNEYKLMELSELFISLEDQPAQLESELHQLAKKCLGKDEIEEAWKILLTFNNQ